MKQAARIWKGCLLGIFAIGFVIAIIPVQIIRWDGGFPNVEYRLRFIDRFGRPVSGVGLKVLTQAGGVCPFYPVNEFLPGEAPTSDEEGRMIFHHVMQGVEYSGTDRLSLLGLALWAQDAPQYDCLFLLGDREVHRVSYNSLNTRDAESAQPPITRNWTFPNWDPSKYLPPEGESMESYGTRLFDGNGDGKLDREEAIARRVYFRGVETPPFVDEICLRVVERTIVIAKP